MASRFTLNRACRSFSRNSFLFLLDSLPSSGLPELYMVAVLLFRMNRIQLLEPLLSFRSRHHRIAPTSCRHSTLSRCRPGLRHRYQTSSPCQGYCKTPETFLNCHAYLIGINISRHNPHKMFTLYVSRVQLILEHLRVTLINLIFGENTCAP